MGTDDGPGNVPHDDTRPGPPTDALGEPACPLCGNELEIVERFGSEWWYCDGEDHAYSREVEP